ncbi:MULTISPECIES: DUF1592 domain-containing protein [unclassified Imperialibacter]|uniref:DUF1592 domain-containing protein n=1 Tax=unclassified Imperialibacter TaxID=2629706 RepID=UPI0012563E89|nr:MULTISPECIES: DUF1592 domain-containing protein [unclassified Imperialibacter]CAD5276328.1 conserved exported hypothetical protein [Imperialibacter sp. 89]CAD5294926.1 conserved exported hypothetical protein [Imperialibacter sp. 75]VVT26724.1 conserved exported hypothetical protein [Imperialibacter sp. EC-SDR9]
MKHPQFICFCLAILLSAFTTKASAQELYDYDTEIRPLLSQKCFECHNTNMPKANVNLDNYKEKARVVKDGAFWLKVLEQIESRDMPPKSKSPLSDEDYRLLVDGINGILQSSLKEHVPGQIVIRRLSHTEYQYTVKDLTGYDFDARSYFPSDGSGGGGFDNQGGSLFITPLKLERYYDAADLILQGVAENEQLWRKIAPEEYDPSWLTRLTVWVKSLFDDSYSSSTHAQLAAEKTILPFATKAYRRFLKDDEKARLGTLFTQVYQGMDSLDNPQRFDQSIAQVYKMVMVSPHFLYRTEEEPPNSKPYYLSDFEMASRLSYFLWSSMPDDELFSLAYMGKLQDTLVLEGQVKRMLADPKARRFAESFSTQWLGINKLLDTQPIVDPEKFPDFDMPLREALYRETVEYFYYVLTDSKNMMELVNSNYTFLNQKLADFYGVEGNFTDEYKKVLLANANRGGVMGMGSVLTVSSLPVRTSPVLRGKYVMEQIMGISPPPPPPEVAELVEDEGAHSELGLRKLLERHRSSPGCFSCHQKMDPLGLGLENFDATGRWRDSYGKVAIDASGTLADGREFNGPAELKVLLMDEKEKIARNLATKVLSYALGRGTIFTDEPALRKLETALLENNFNPDPFIVELVKSYPFRMKINDFRDKINEVL